MMKGLLQPTAQPMSWTLQVLPLLAGDRQLR